MSDGSTLRMPTPGAPELPRRRRRRWPWAVLGIVLVLVALFVVLDRVTVAYAENQAAQQMQSQGFPTRPDVTIKGFPFLTQVAAKRLNDVHITASDVRPARSSSASPPMRPTSCSIPASRAARSATSPAPA